MFSKDADHGADVSAMSHLGVHAELVAIALGGAEDDSALVPAGPVHAHDVVNCARTAVAMQENIIVLGYGAAAAASFIAAPKSSSFMYAAVLRFFS